MVSIEVMAVYVGAVSAALVMCVAWCVCAYLDQITRDRIEQDKRDLSKIRKELL